MDKEKDFGTMDAHFTTNYETDMVLDPHQTIEPFKEQLVSGLQTQFKTHSSSDTYRRSTRCLPFANKSSKMAARSPQSSSKASVIMSLRLRSSLSIDA